MLKEINEDRRFSKKLASKEIKIQQSSNWDKVKDLTSAIFGTKE